MKPGEHPDAEQLVFGSVEEPWRSLRRKGSSSRLRRIARFELSHMLYYISQSNVRIAVSALRQHTRPSGSSLVTSKRENLNYRKIVTGDCAQISSIISLLQSTVAQSKVSTARQSTLHSELDEICPVRLFKT